MRTALGFSVHTGWAAAILVAAEAPHPRVVARERLEFATRDRFVFHRAAEIGLPAAEDYVRRATAEARELAAGAVSRFIDGRKGLAAAGVIVGNLPVTASLEKILGAHPLLHSAEGELYRRVVAEACRAAGLRTLEVPAKQIAGAPPSTWLADAGRDAGRPWGKDQRDAYVVACLALATRVT